MESLEAAIKSKDYNFQELLMLSYDANHAKEIALNNFKIYED